MAEKLIKCEFNQLAVGGLYDVHIPTLTLTQQATQFVKIHRSTLMAVADIQGVRFATFESGVKVVDGTKGLWFERVCKV